MSIAVKELKPVFTKELNAANAGGKTYAEVTAPKSPMSAHFILSVCLRQGKGSVKPIIHNPFSKVKGARPCCRSRRKRRRTARSRAAFPVCSLRSGLSGCGPAQNGSPKPPVSFCMVSAASASAARMASFTAATIIS